MKEIKVLGIDLAKNNFSLCALSENGEIIFRKSMNRAELIEFTANLKPTLIGFEACGGAHYFGRLFLSQGHRPKMMSVMAVKPFCPLNKKNDAVDAEAIAVAALQPTVRSVRVKSVSDQDLDVLKNIERELEAILAENKNYKLLKSIPGVGLLTAAQVLSCTGGSVERFKNGRQFAAYLGLVPRQHSTGGKTRLRGITKTGPSDLRKLLVVGTRSVLFRSTNKKDKVNEWITEKKNSKGFMKANIALANKTARIIFAVMKSEKPYRLNA